MSADITAPTPSAPAAAPVAPKGGFTSTEDLFSSLESMIGIEDDETMPDGTSPNQFKPGTEEDLLNLDTAEEGTGELQTEEGKEEGTPSDGTEGTDTEGSQTDSSGEAFNPMPFKRKIGDKEYDFQIKSREQFDNIVAKAIVADDVYKRYQTLNEEVETLRSDKGTLDRIDEMLESEPESFLDSVTEDMPDEVLKAWIVKKADELSTDPQQRMIQKRLKNEEILREKLAAIEEENLKLQQKRVQAAREADSHTVQAWMQTKKTMFSTKIPEKYQGLVEDQLKYVIMEARDRSRRKEQVTIKTLDSMLAQRMQPIIELVQNAKTKNVDTEVGKAIQQKKQQGLTRIQAAASARAPTNFQKTNMQRLVQSKDNPIGIFDEILKGMDSGQIRIRGE